MKQAPFFSVVIPSYNRAEFILQTLESVFSQRFDSFEVIVVDNASTDNTKEILKPLIDAGKINFIAHDKNYERAKSRNTGMKFAKGEYVTFLDSDDFMLPDNLSDAYQYVQNHSTTYLFHNLYQLVDQDNAVLYQYSFPPIKNPLDAIARGNFLSCIGVFLHAKIYKTIDWDEHPLLTGSEDYDYWLRVMVKYRSVGRIPKVNSNILHHGARTINNQDAVQTQARFEYMIEKYQNDKEFTAAYKNRLNTIKATLWLFLAGLYLSAGDKTQVLKWLKNAFFVDTYTLKRKEFYSLVAGIIR
jgi:glycosyltransferase involved in cell wall biosynthesis